MYSPEIYNAEQDYLLATRGASVSPTVGSGEASDAGPNRVEGLARAARQKLHLLGVGESAIDDLAKRGMPHESVPMAAPASGFVTEKNVVDGASVDPGMRLYRIAAINKVWVEAEVYEADFTHVHVGQAAAVTLDYLPGQEYDARVAYVYPYLDAKTRTGRVRIELGNKRLDLRPGMYANVALTRDLGRKIQVPVAAVVYTGPRRLVFVDLGDGRFLPKEVTLGAEANGKYEVLSGLVPGEVVATSGTFLIAAEARISTAAKYWESSSEVDAGVSSTGAEDPSEAAPATSSITPPAARPVPTREPPPSLSNDGATPASSSAPMDAAAAAVVYSCPMHPEVQSVTPGNCPKCGMKLEPMPKGGGR